MLTKKDWRALKIAKKLLKRSTHSRYRLAAVVIQSGRVIGRGVNKEFAAPRPYIKSNRLNLHLHAEVDALHGLKKEETRGATLYVTGETVNGTIINSRPCSYCMPFICAMGISKIVCTDQTGEHEFKL